MFILEVILYMQSRVWATFTTKTHVKEGDPFVRLILIQKNYNIKSWLVSRISQIILFVKVLIPGKHT